MGAGGPLWEKRVIIHCPTVGWWLSSTLTETGRHLGRPRRPRRPQPHKWGPQERIQERIYKYLIKHSKLTKAKVFTQEVRLVNLREWDARVGSGWKVFIEGEEENLRPLFPVLTLLLHHHWLVTLPWQWPWAYYKTRNLGFFICKHEND